MCGISAVICHAPGTSPVSIVFDGLRQLQNRGYDSAGIGISLPDRPKVIRCASTRNDSLDMLQCNIEEEAKRHLLPVHRVAIGHTRWATHGDQSPRNAHPHCDAKSQVALVHNGTIDNHQEIRQELTRAGVEFKSDTDTEVIVQLIGERLNRHTQGESCDFSTLVQQGISELKGTFALALTWTKLPDALFLARRTIPLWLGCNEAKTLFHAVSETNAFSPQVTLKCLIPENTTIELKVGDSNVICLAEPSLSTWTCHRSAPTVELVSTHWTLQEIEQQPDAIGECVKRFLQSTDKHCFFPEFPLIAPRRVLFSGCGSSMYACLLARSLLNKWRDNPSHSWARFLPEIIAFDASEGRHVHWPTHETSCLLAVSQSGETRDVLDVVGRARTAYKDQKGVCVVGALVNQVDTLLSTISDFTLFMDIGSEKAVASTKSFVLQTLFLVVSVLKISHVREVTTKKMTQEEQGDSQKGISILTELKSLSYAVTESISLAKHHTAPLVHQLVKDQHLLLLGNGPALFVAQEGALKLKELSYIHAEGFSAASLKHGPFALLSENMTVIIIRLSDEYMPSIDLSIQQVSARHARVVVLSDAKSPDSEYPLPIAQSKDCQSFLPLIAIVPLQLLAYYLALARGINPDRPRNLAKSVTVH